MTLVRREWIVDGEYVPLADHEAAIREAVAAEREAMTKPAYACQLCGERYPARGHLLFDLKGDAEFPGGAKVTCLKCWGRLEEREACAKVAEAHGQTIGENCWNHENSPEGRSSCWADIAAAIRARGEPQPPTSRRQDDEIQFYAGMGQAPVTKAVSSAGRRVEVDWSRASRLDDEDRGRAEVRFRVDGGEWHTKGGSITRADPRLNLVDDVDADFSRLFDAAHDPADLRDSASKPDDVDRPADHFGDLGGEG